MSTKQTSTGTNTSDLQFNPIAQGIYNQLVSGGGNVLSQYMSSPFSNPMYQQGAALSQAGAQASGANNMAALKQNQLTSGLTGQAGAGWLGVQSAQTGRANQAMMGQANTQNVLAALQRQMMAAGTGLSFSPQLTGQKGTFSQTSQNSGLGTWLPQLLGAAGSAALGGLTGGMSGAMGGAFGGAASNPASSAPSVMQPSYMPGMGGGMAGMPSMGLSGMYPGQAPPPFPYLGGSSLYTGQ